MTAIAAIKLTIADKLTIAELKPAPIEIENQFVLPRTQNSNMGILTAFSVAGLLGYSLGPKQMKWPSQQKKIQ
jgi:hypothetical protein